MSSGVAISARSTSKTPGDHVGIFNLAATGGTNNASTHSAHRDFEVIEQTCSFRIQPPTPPPKGAVSPPAGTAVSPPHRGRLSRHSREENGRPGCPERRVHMRGSQANDEFAPSNPNAHLPLPCLEPYRGTITLPEPVVLTPEPASDPARRARARAGSSGAAPRSPVKGARWHVILGRAYLQIRRVPGASLWHPRRSFPYASKTRPLGSKPCKLCLISSA